MICNQGFCIIVFSCSQKSLEYTKDCKIPKALGMGNAGTVELEGSIDRRGYCSGEKIALSGKYWNIHYINYSFLS